MRIKRNSKSKTKYKNQMISVHKYWPNVNEEKCGCGGVYVQQMKMWSCGVCFDEVEHRTEHTQEQEIK